MRVLAAILELLSVFFHVGVELNKFESLWTIREMRVHKNWSNMLHELNVTLQVIYS